MKPPSKTLDDADVLLWAAIDANVVATGICTHTVHGRMTEKAAALAICVYLDPNPGSFLFYCDHEWHVLAYTWPETLESAQRQAEVEYRSFSALWRPRA